MTNLPKKPRHDGWTAQRRTTFLAALRQSGCVRDACRVADISSTSAYRLRGQDAGFAARWDTALANAKRGLIAVAHERAVVGRETVIMRGGKEFERRITPSDAMLALLIKHGVGGAPGNEGAHGRIGGRTGARTADRVISWEEWQDGIQFDTAGKKYQAMPPSEVRASLDAKLAAMRERLDESDLRSINIRTGEGIDEEIIAAVLRHAGDDARIVQGRAPEG